MKLSTALICAISACGLFSAILLTACCPCLKQAPRYADERPQMIELAGDSVTVPLGEVNVIDYIESKSPRNIKIKNYKGIAVCESDTARSAWLVTTTDWLPFLGAYVDDKALTISMQRHLLAERYKEHSVISTRNWIIATVVVPRGAVDNFYASSHTLYLDSIRARRITAMVTDRLVINQSRIDSLLLAGKGPRELKYEDSKISWITDSGLDWHRPGQR